MHTWWMGRLYSTLVFAIGVGSAAFQFGCARSLDLSNRQCPCIDGFVCDTATNRCVRPSDVPVDEEDASADVPADVPTDVPRPKRVFLSSATYDGNLGGLAGADATCNALASTAELGGTWKAWLSASGTGERAKERVQDVGPWYLVDETTLVASNRAELIACTTLPQIIDMNEYGNTIDGSLTFWTGHDCYGDQTSHQCSDWTMSEYLGGMYSNGAAWSAATIVYCTHSNRLLCFEQ